MMGDKREETPNLLNQIVSQAGQDPPTPPENPPPEPQKQEKTRANYYLSVDVLNDLDKVWLFLRESSGSKRISKSKIVETALRIALDEVAQRREASQLAKLLTQ